MRVVLISHDDYANFAFDQAESLKSVGINCDSFKMIPHVFGYEKQSQVVTLGRIQSEMHWADVIILMHSTTLFNNVLPRGKKIVVWHTGSPYRFSPDNMNRTFNPIVELTLTDQCEFMNLGANNIHYNAAAINDGLYPRHDYEIKYPYTFGHFPSNSEVKGTADIIEMIRKSKTAINFQYSIERATHHEQIRRMKSCDIYIELFKPELRGRPYGCFGVTAFEAAALGKVVITNNIYKDVYIEAYGQSELLIANTIDDFIDKVEILMEMSINEIREKQNRTYSWLIQNHSYQANGTRLKKLLSL